jgi:hypothetical protein
MLRKTLGDTLVRTQLVADGNLGLANSVIDACIQAQVIRLTRTFVSFRLADVARATGLSSAREAELYVLGMIAEGVLSDATIDQLQGTVRFSSNRRGNALDKSMYARFRLLQGNSESGTKLNEREAELLQQMNSMASLSARLRALDERLFRDPKYLRCVALSLCGSQEPLTAKADAFSNSSDSQANVSEMEIDSDKAGAEPQVGGGSHLETSFGLGVDVPFGL